MRSRPASCGTTAKSMDWARSRGVTRLLKLIKLQIAAVAVTIACSKISSIPNPPLEDAPWRRPLSSIAAGMSARAC